LPRRSRAAHVRIYVSCPSDDMLIALVEHALGADELTALAAHVDRCAACRAMLAAIASLDTGRRTRCALEESH
jgi:hypothetical protein